MATLLRMPAISANVTEAVLNDWPLTENTAFSAGDPIATVETDKAVVDVPAEADGVLIRTLVEPGRAVPVGTPMAVLAAPHEVIGDIEALVAQLLGDQPASPPSPTTNGVVRVFASPLARRLARENGLHVNDITGTGPGGRVVRDDVHRAIADRTAPAAEPAPAPTSAPASGLAPAAAPASAPATGLAPASASTPAVTAVSGVGFDVVPHSRMRRAIASRLAASARETPVFTIRGSARVDELLAVRKELNAAGGVKISVNDLVVAAAARAQVAVPDMNVRWTEDAVHRFHDVDVSIAVATDAGLVTPVVRRASELTISALARVGAGLVERARDGKLRQDELEGGALTVTNLGSYGVEEFTAVINPPQAAILAVGAARPEAVVVDGEIGVATVLRVTLSVDHRPVDGALAARWMAHFLGLLEAPLRILA
ncbi:dihydrolipoamide acetyltransferase family protein [Paractinoplanes globisporus]|uniref:Dihydrolipoamide acetyltransferase component of pyruvate dehydrogenase complex n=1 Tax=Paractinoplanes globisporus TaxID=113565 RepID=A0ABW6W9D4_9ACTN|nr:dihydrolipoamide acetyltransferase family protein [Actinoplanes globisporus]